VNIRYNKLQRRGSDVRDEIETWSSEWTLWQYFIWWARSCCWHIRSIFPAAFHKIKSVQLQI